MERRSEHSDSPRTETIVDARMSLALWLRAGRAHRGMSLDDVAKITKIQPRILERLEAGKLEGLPADVFVRGFVRSFARCVGLAEEEALRRYAACSVGGMTGMTGMTGPSDTTRSASAGITPAARALVEAMVELVPDSATAARATPRRMVAVDVGDLATGSLRDLPAGGTVVETMMLPETGTVVMPAQPTASLAEAMTDSDTIAEASSVSTASLVAAVLAPNTLLDESDRSTEASPPLAESAAALPSIATATPAVADLPAALIHLYGGAVESTQSIKKKRGRRGKGRNKRTTGGAASVFSREPLAVGTPADASPIVTAPEASVVPEISAMLEAAKPHGSAMMTAASVAPPESDPIAASSSGPSIDEPIATATWAPRMPPLAAAPSVPWRKPAYAGSPPASAAVVVPSLVIDDADPDSAERILEERAEKHAMRRSFLPPILLDREDRSARQGGLTLAVIILLIAATLTLSYLMRRPSAGGDGMTRLDTPAGMLDSPSWEASFWGSPARG